MTHRKLKHRPPAGAPESQPAAPPPVAVPAAPWWRRHGVALVLLWVLAAAAYSNSFRSGLVYDNYLALKEDARVHQATAENLHLILSQTYWYKVTPSALYRPLTTLSYLFNYAILHNGEAPAGYHVFNLAVHLANIALVYALGWLLLGEFWPAFAMAAIWAVHPVLTESVTNIVGRADLLAAFGVLAGLLCYARSVTAAGRRRILWLAALFAASAIGVFSKETGVVVVAAVFLYDIAWLRQKPLGARLPGYAAAALPVIFFLVVRARLLAGAPEAVVGFVDNPLVAADFWTARLTAVKVLGRYLWLLICPLRLTCDYSFNQIPVFSWNLGRWEDWQAVLGLAIYLGAAVLAVRSYRRTAPVFFGIGFYLCAMAPTANIFLLIGTIMAERVLYLPSVGFAGCVAWAGWWVYRWARPRWPAMRMAAPAALALLCLAFAGRTFARNFDWVDEKSLWSSAERVSTDSFRVYHHLSIVYSNTSTKNLPEADRQADRALAIVEPLPDDERPAIVYSSAGRCYRETGDSLGAAAGAPWYRKALDTLLEGKKVDEACDAAMQHTNQLEGKTIAPTHWVPLYLELGHVYRILGQYQESLRASGLCQFFDPKAECFEELSQTYQAMGDNPRGVITLFEGITMDATDQVRLAAEVVDLYQRTVPDSCALTGPPGAPTLNFECPLVRSQLCMGARNVAVLYRQMNRESDAMATVAGAVRGLGCPVDVFR